MSDSAETASFEAGAGQPVAASAGAAWSPNAGSSAGGGLDEHPELLIGGAFLGGLILATILKRLAD